MSRTHRFQSRMAFALAFMLAIAGIIGAVRVSALPASAQVVESVLLSCDAPAADGSTTCVFSATGGEQLAVPADGICGEVVSSSGTFDGGAYVSAFGDPSVVLTFAGSVAPGGSATYTVTSGGVASSVGGSGVVCTEAPVEVATEDAAPPVEETVVEAPVDDVVVDDTATDVATEEPTDVAAPEETAVVDEGTPAADDGFEPANVIVDPGTTVTPPTETIPATVTILSYLCDSDPGATDPASAGCTPASGINYSADDSDGDLGSAVTDGSGSTSFTSRVGATFIVEQTANVSGYRVRGDGRYEVLALAGDTTITFVNVKKEALGRLQIAAGLCPTSGENRTEFSIADQDHVTTASLMSCQPNGGAIFTVNSASLPGGSWTVRMESDGSWRGYVPAGTYSVTAPDGTESGAITVADGAISVAVAVTYAHQDQGTLTLENFLCTEGTDGEYVVINPSSAPDASCGVSAGTIYVSDELAGGDPTAFTVAQNGSTPIRLKPGLYRVTGPQGATDLVTVSANATVVARVLTVSTTGALLVSGFTCPAGVYPESAAEFQSECVDPWGSATLTLDASGGAGIAVTLSGGGSALVDNLLPDTYALGGGNVCAVLNGDTDVTDGFTITAGLTTAVSVYGCFSGNDGTGNPDGGGPGGGTGGGDGTGGNASGPDGSGIGGDGTDGTGIDGSHDAYGSNSVLAVTALPNTGAGTGASQYWMSLLLLALAAGFLAAGYRLRGRHSGL